MFSVAPFPRLSPGKPLSSPSIACLCTVRKAKACRSADPALAVHVTAPLLKHQFSLTNRTVLRCWIGPLRSRSGRENPLSISPTQSAKTWTRITGRAKAYWTRRSQPGLNFWRNFGHFSTKESFVPTMKLTAIPRASTVGNPATKYCESRAGIGPGVYRRCPGVLISGRACRRPFWRLR